MSYTPPFVRFTTPGDAEVIASGSLLGGHANALTPATTDAFKRQLRAFNLELIPQTLVGEFALQGPQLDGSWDTSFVCRTRTQGTALQWRQAIGLALFHANIPTNAQRSRTDVYRLEPADSPAGTGRSIFDRLLSAPGEVAASAAGTVREVARVPLYVAILGAVLLVGYFALGGRAGVAGGGG